MDSMQYQLWWVWEDWSCDDVLAVPASEVTDTLRARLEHERIVLRHIEAQSRAQAVRLAFPHRFDDSTPLEPLADASLPPVTSRSPRIH